jgi:hypothetical protein
MTAVTLAITREMPHIRETFAWSYRKNSWLTHVLLNC